MKKISKLILILILATSFYNCLGANAGKKDVIAVVNDEEIYLQNFNRLLTAQEKSYIKENSLGLFKTADKESEGNRKKTLTEAKKLGIVFKNNELDRMWLEKVQEVGGMKKLKAKAKAYDIPVSDIKKKFKEDVVLNRYFDKHKKDKLVEVLINEVLVIQEAENRNIDVTEDEVNNRLALLKIKSGGEAVFNKLLKQNNATVSDAENEIRNEILYNKVKKDICKSIIVHDDEIINYYNENDKQFKKNNISLESVSDHIESILKDKKSKKYFNSYLNRKKATSSIIIYNNYLSSNSQITEKKSSPFEPPKLVHKIKEPVEKTESISQKKDSNIIETKKTAQKIDKLQETLDKITNSRAVKAKNKKEEIQPVRKRAPFVVKRIKRRIEPVSNNLLLEKIAARKTPLRRAVAVKTKSVEGKKPLQKAITKPVVAKTPVALRRAKPAKKEDFVLNKKDTINITLKNNPLKENPIQKVKEIEKIREKALRAEKLKKELEQKRIAAVKRQMKEAKKRRERERKESIARGKRLAKEKERREKIAAELQEKKNKEVEEYNKKLARKKAKEERLALKRMKEELKKKEEYEKKLLAEIAKKKKQEEKEKRKAEIAAKKEKERLEKEALKIAREEEKERKRIERVIKAEARKLKIEQEKIKKLVIKNYKRDLKEKRRAEEITKEYIKNNATENTKRLVELKKIQEERQAAANKLVPGKPSNVKFHPQPSKTARANEAVDISNLNVFKSGKGAQMNHNEDFNSDLKELINRVENRK